MHTKYSNETQIEERSSRKEGNSNNAVVTEETAATGD
jgi:hypothetical protein